MSSMQDWWYARCRRLDMQLLWPACVEQCETLYEAKAIFTFHCFNDKAWLRMGEHWITGFIDGLDGEEGR